MTSQLKTALLLGALTALILIIGSAMGGQTGLVIAFFFALAMNVGSYWFSDKIVLSMYKARELAPHDAPGLHAMIEELARNAGVPKPKLYIVPQESPNAFATGRNPENAAVAVTEGLMRILSPEEVRGVLAHEMAHVANRDILIQTVAAILGSVIMMLSSMIKWGAILGMGRSSNNEGGNPIAAIVLAILAPMAAMVIQMAISRSREYLADATGARISHQPLALASALDKLDRTSRGVPLDASPATENMFIVSPFSGGSMARWFSTHPPIPERIARLRAMAGK